MSHSFDCISDFFLVFNFLQFDCDVSAMDFLGFIVLKIHWAFWIFKFMSFTKFGKFLAIIENNIFWRVDETHVRHLVLPFVIFYSICCLSVFRSDIFYLYISSFSMIISSVISIPLLSLLNMWFVLIIIFNSVIFIWFFLQVIYFIVHILSFHCFKSAVKIATLKASLDKSNNWVLSALVSYFSPGKLRFSYVNQICVAYWHLNTVLWGFWSCSSPMKNVAPSVFIRQ